MTLQQAQQIAERIKSELAPHCDRIPKPYETGLFASGIAKVVDQWQKVKGDLPCKYTQRILPDGIKLDMFFAEPENWGLIYAIRTGSAEYSHKVLAAGWVKAGYQSRDGYLWHGRDKYNCREETDLYNRIGLTWIEPEFRNV